MENYQILRLEQPRGPVFETVIRANFQVGNRAARALGINMDEMQGIVAYGLSDKLGNLGVPSDRTVRQWEFERFDYPEQMIKAGFVSVVEILPPLRTYLDFNGYGASMQQASLLDGPSSVPSQITQIVEPVAWLESLFKISLFIGAICLAGSILKGARNPPNQRYNPPPKHSHTRPLSLADRRNRYRRN